MQSAPQYESVMRDAKEMVFLVAARRGMDPRLINVEIDAGLGPGQHKVHVLVISLRGAHLSVRNRKIDHEWLLAGTGFINDRFAKEVAALLSDLAAQAQNLGIMLSKKG